MDPTSLVSYELTSEMKQAGMALLADLDQKRTRISTAMWWFDVLGEAWVLILSSAQISEIGVRAFNRKVMAARHRVAPTIGLSTIVTLPESHPLIVAIRRIHRTSFRTVSGAYIRSSSFDDLEISAAYIYRSS